MQRINYIKVFEHGFLKVGMSYGAKKIKLKKEHFLSLVKLNELHNDKYFTVGLNKIKFKQYVGVIQVGNLCIEILPKADKTSGGEVIWQSVLIEMLKTTKRLKVQKVGNAKIDKQNKHLLDIYFDWYLNELQLLIRQGLIRQYGNKRNNLHSLKGKLIFSKHISKNVIHKERFFLEHQVYDYDHLIHQILFQALCVVEQFSKGKSLYSKCKTIALDFPEVKSIQALESTFNKLPKNRKTKPYVTALQIARFIILNYAPNVTKGKEEMLALLFNMNDLWEQYITEKLRQALRSTSFTVYGQQSRNFWKGITIRPDIVIKQEEKTVLVIDTKWKNIWRAKPSTNDLRQMYVYNDYWQSPEAILLLPHTDNLKTISEPFEEKGHRCGLMWISVLKNGVLNTNIGKELKEKFIFEEILLPQPEEHPQYALE